MRNRDLSRQHQLIGDLFNSQFDDTSVSNDQAAFFDANGYIAGIKLLSDVQIEALRQDLSTMMLNEYADDPRFYEYHSNESADPAKALFHALGAWRVSPSFHDLVFYPPLIKIAAKLLGGQVRLWHDQIFVKPAGDGAVVAWHQDYSYWTRTKPVSHLTCWIGLDDSMIENGCVHYVPGSHRWNLLPRTDLATDMNAVLHVLTPEQHTAFLPVPIELRAGEASFHHPMLVHGSYENSSDKPRRAVVINFIRDGVCSDSDEPLLAGVPPVSRDEVLTGRFFPLLLS